MCLYCALVWSSLPLSHAAGFFLSARTDDHTRYLDASHLEKGRPVGEQHWSCHQVAREEAEDQSHSSNVAVLIPFREQMGKERQRELGALLQVLEANAKTHANAAQPTQFRFFVAEQSDKGGFNRGMLMNIAFDRASRHFKGQPFSAIATDCDFVPDDHMMKWYTKVGDSPLHLANYAYCPGFGGVTVFSAEQYREINGYSNDMWGWGGEDDDAMDRWMAHPERRVIAPAGDERFKDLGKMLQTVTFRDKRDYAHTVASWKEDDANQRWVSNGLSNLDYKVVGNATAGRAAGLMELPGLVEHVVVELPAPQVL